MKKVSIIIINHNTKQLCDQTIASAIKATHNADFEIIVVDNSSDPEEAFVCTDGSVTVYSGIKNNGFGAACNIGVKNAKGELLLFLNSDTLLNDGAIDNCVVYLDTHRDVGALGIKTTLEDGSFDHGCKRGFPTPARSLSYFMGLDRLFPKSKLLGGYRMTYLSNDETNEVDAVSGAFLMVRSVAFKQIGGFDEDFFMYGEDIDLCYRLKQADYKVVYFAGASMVHLKGQSGLKTRSPGVLYNFYNAMHIFYRKHYEKNALKPVSWLIHAAISAKYKIAKNKLDKNK